MTTQQPAPDRLLDVDALARTLDVSTRGVWRLVQRGTIPYLRVGRFVRFHLPEVLDALRESRDRESA